MALRDKKHLRWVAEQPCCMCDKEVAGVAHHPLGGGMGLKSDDFDAIPLCDPCHRQLHMCQGPFRKMGKLKRRAWEAAQVQRIRDAWEGPNE